MHLCVCSDLHVYMCTLRQGRTAIADCPKVNYTNQIKSGGVQLASIQFYISVNGLYTSILRITTQKVTNCKTLYSSSLKSLTAPCISHVCNGRQVSYALLEVFMCTSDMHTMSLNSCLLYYINQFLFPSSGFFCISSSYMVCSYSK